MSMRITGSNLSRFRSDLTAHRDTFAGNDADYAEKILKVALNTYKKCISPNTLTLKLKRQTLINLFSNAPLDPRNYGINLAVPSKASSFGGYQKSEFEFLCGRFQLYRRTFLTGGHITQSVLDVRPSETLECLTFDEFHHYVAESGAQEEVRYQGEVHINQERTVLSMPAYHQGQVRLTLLQYERLPKRLKFRGAVLAFGNPKGYWQPTVSSVYVEGPAKDAGGDRRLLCRTIRREDADFSVMSKELEFTENYSTIMTPLMWERLKAGPN